jgi:hypothetical protein
MTVPCPRISEATSADWYFSQGTSCEGGFQNQGSLKHRLSRKACNRVNHSFLIEGKG